MSFAKDAYIDRRHYATPAQVAAALHISAETVRRWARTGRVRAVQLPGGRWLIHRDVLARPPK